MESNQPHPVADESVWMSFEEYQLHKRLMNQQEAACLRAHGLGWLIDFCSPKTKEDVTITD